MTWTQEERRKAKLRELRILQGLPSTCTPGEVAEAMAHVRNLHGQGMGIHDLSRASGGVTSTIFSDLVRGARGGGSRRPGGSVGLQRSTYDKVMSIRYAPPSGRSSHVPALGSMRRLRALLADGHPSQSLADQLGWSKYYVNKFVSRPKDWIFAHTRDAISDVYLKLELADPMGEPGIVKRARLYAQRNLWAPAHTWDIDTMDSPLAFPEWTGACGSGMGHQIHLRKNIPVGLEKPPGSSKWIPVLTCRPCADAHNFSHTVGRTRRRTGRWFEQ